MLKLRKVFKKIFLSVVFLFLSNLFVVSVSAADGTLYGINLNEVANYQSMIVEDKDLVYCYSYQNGEFKEREMTIDEFYKQTGIRMLGRNNPGQVYYALNDVAAVCGYVYEKDSDVMTLENEMVKAEIQLVKIPGTAIHYYTWSVLDKTTNTVDKSSDVYEENQGNCIKVDGEVYVNEGIFRRIYTGVVYDGLRIEFVNGNYYVLDMVACSFDDKFFIDFDEEGNAKLVHALYLLYKNCPEFYENVIKLDKVVLAARPAKVVRNSALGYVYAHKPTIYITSTGISSDDGVEMASVLAHEAQHIMDYKKTKRSPEVSAYTTSCKVKAALGESMNSILRSIPKDGYSDEDWFKG